MKQKLSTIASPNELLIPYASNNVAYRHIHSGAKTKGEVAFHVYYPICTFDGLDRFETIKTALRNGEFTFDGKPAHIIPPYITPSGELYFECISLSVLANGLYVDKAAWDAGDKIDDA